MALERAGQIYSSYSSVYDLFFDTILQPGRVRAVEVMDIRPGEKVLEVGVGTGLSLPLYPSHCEVTGIDISDGMLAEAQEKVSEQRLRNVVLKKMSAEALEYEAAAFDKVLLSYVISCVSRPDAVIREVARVIRPGGRVIFLNHFRSPNRFKAWFEHHLTPLSRRLGFVLDLPLDKVTGSGEFRLELIERVNLLGLWSLVCCARKA